MRETKASDLTEAIRRYSRPLDDLQTIVDAIHDADFVLIGEASHGTSEFYTWRAELTKRLIEQKGFSFIAVEGDWPSCYTLNRYVKGYAGAAADARDALCDFTRWPTWMWNNREIADFAEWLRACNDKRSSETGKVGFYGIDVYSLWESMDELMRYFEGKPGSDMEAVRRAFECFEPFARDEQSYGVSAALFDEGCEDEAIGLLRKLQDKWKISPREDREAALNAELNAQAVVGAEKYYRTMIRGDAESWNVRDRHMVSVLEKLIEFSGQGAKAVVWEHNTHIGDARATDMAADGMVNVGQLLREKYGERVFAVGFGTYEGTVIAGDAWGAPAEVMPVPPAVKGSWEELLHRTGGGDKLLLLRETDDAFTAEVGHRAVGVVYHPRREWGNYVPSVIARRYDAFIYLDRTQALRPLAMEPVHSH